VPSQRSILLAVVVLAVLGGGAVVVAVLSRHSSRFLAGRAWRTPEAQAALRRSLEERREELARTLQREGGAVQAASDLGEKREAAIRALGTGQELGSVASALMPLIEEPRRPAVEQQLSDLRRGLLDLDRLANRPGREEPWAAAGRAKGAACAAACLGPRDRCWAGAGGYAPKCEGLALEAAACVTRCR